MKEPKKGESMMVPRELSGLQTKPEAPENKGYVNWKREYRRTGFFI